jgi:hypothetical protein
MRNTTLFALSVLVAVAVVLRLSGWGMGANRGKRGSRSRPVAREPEYEGERGLSETREAYPEREVTVQEGLPSGTQPEGRTRPSAARIAGYVFLVVIGIAVGTVLGGVLAVWMEYLVGWPDTWWL